VGAPGQDAQARTYAGQPSALSDTPKSSRNSHRWLCSGIFSCHDQKEDLERQEAAVKSQAGKPVDLIISDLGSGRNYKKAGFRQLLWLILQGKVKELILTHKDRLLRFGSEIIFQICQFCGVKITILNDAPENRTWNSSALIWWKS
jgi:predicted site-specific integrase-resolvase